MSRAVIMAGWDDVPHLDEKAKAEMLKNLPPHQRESRSKGVPSLGAGAIYPVAEEEIKVKPFLLPAFWPRAYGMDVGWNRTAVVWGAQDPDSKVWYLYSEHYKGQAEPSVHSAAIKSRGDWIAGAIDPASRGRSQKDGENLLESYIQLGLILTKANNSVESGLYDVFELLSTGQLKVFSTLVNWFKEYRLYRRDEKGHVVKENDHCLHAQTKVITADGIKEIQNMVGTEGRVLTIGGRWADFKNCRKTQENAEVVELVFSDGYKVTCTKNHRFLTVSGWVEAGDMLGKFCYNEVPKRIQGATKWKLKFSLQQLKNLMVFGITNAVNIFRETARDCIERYGNILMAKFQPVFMSTTLTKTEQTTVSRILSLNQPQNILASILKAFTSQFQIMRLSPQQSGMVATMEKSGTGGITSGTRAIFIKRLAAAALCAAINLSAGRIRAESFAQMPAKQNTGLFLALITKLGNVLSAVKTLFATSMLRKKPAQEFVRQQLRCVSVLPAGKADVYCLEVPATQAFAIENGVIVHNCMDATRYFVTTGRNIARTKPHADYSERKPINWRV